MTQSEVEPWNIGVIGTQVLPLINSDDPIIKVEAGPGTGKTFGLVRRIQRILHPEGLNVPGNQVLVVAFSRVIAKQLKSDIDAVLSNSKHHGKPVIRTVHALCLQAVGQEIRLLLPHEREAMLYDVLNQYPALQTEFDTHSKAEQALRDHEAKHVNHPALWQAIERWLLRHKARLIGDLPSLLLDQLKVGDVAPQTYQHVIVDEFQDLTPGEQELFSRMRAPGGSFLALGDPRQSIFKFRGNDRDGLANLESLLKVGSDDINTINMTECQRCPGDVVKAANQLTSLDSALPMVPDMMRKANTHVVVWNTPEKEAEGMAKAIVANVAACPNNEEHLVMVTRRQFGFMLRDAIYNLAPQLRVDLSFSESVLQTWAVREAFLFFCLLTDPDAATWRAWLGYQDSSDGRDYKSPKRNADAYLKALTANADVISESVIRSYAEGGNVPKGSGGSKIVERAQRYFALKGKFGGIGENASVFINALFDVDKWTSANAQDYKTAIVDMSLLLEKTTVLLDEIKEAENAPTNSMEQLRRATRILRYDIAVREPFATERKVDVLVTTMWSAKGVTANHVYVGGLTAQTIPGERRDDYPGTEVEHNDEQRRVFYVSITRSKNTLVLSRTKKIKRGVAAQLGLNIQSGTGAWANLAMSPFLRDIIDYLPQVVQGDMWPGCKNP